jgi:hypothetical protein
VGEIPRVTADWQWSGEWPVTTYAVMRGAWALPSEKRLVLLFVNVGDDPVSARLDFDSHVYGLEAEKLQVAKLIAEASEDRFSIPPVVQRELTFPPRTAWAWELTPE